MGLFVHTSYAMQLCCALAWRRSYFVVSHLIWIYRTCAVPPQRQSRARECIKIPNLNCYWHNSELSIQCAPNNKFYYVHYARLYRKIKLRAWNRRGNRLCQQCRQCIEQSSTFVSITSSNDSLTDEEKQIDAEAKPHQSRIPLRDALN